MGKNKIKIYKEEIKVGLVYSLVTQIIALLNLNPLFSMFNLVFMVQVAGLYYLSKK